MPTFASLASQLNTAIASRPRAATGTGPRVAKAGALDAYAKRGSTVQFWLALLLIRIAERASGHGWRRIATELQRLHLVTLQGEAGTVQQTTQPTDIQRAILAALETEPPPRITALDPA